MLGSGSRPNGFGNPMSFISFIAERMPFNASKAATRLASVGDVRLVQQRQQRRHSAAHGKKPRGHGRRLSDRMPELVPAAAHLRVLASTRFDALLGNPHL